MQQITTANNKEPSQNFQHLKSIVITNTETFSKYGNFSSLKVTSLKKCHYLIIFNIRDQIGVNRRLQFCTTCSGI